jgi:hypothetical protein
MERQQGWHKAPNETNEDENRKKECKRHDGVHRHDEHFFWKSLHIFVLTTAVGM